MSETIRLNESVVNKQSRKNISEVLDSGWLITGPFTEKFEKAFGKMFNAKYITMLTSCTAGLHLATELALWKGKKPYPEYREKKYVLTTPNTFVATNLAIVLAGGIPLFTDIDLETGNIKIDDDVEDLIIDMDAKLCDIAAIMAVHYGGYPCEMDRISKIARKMKIPVIQDAAHAVGATYKDNWIGSFGDYICFSFNAKKNLSCGDGGVLVTRKKSDCDMAMKLRWFGIDKTTFERSHLKGGKNYKWNYDVAALGHKYNPTDIIAALAYGQLPSLLQDNDHRRFLMNQYRNLLAGTPGVILPVMEEDRTTSAHLMVIRIEEGRDQLIKKLNDEDIECGVHYKPNTAYKAFDGSKSYAKKYTPEAWKWYETALTLPLHLNMDMGHVERICKIIRKGW